MRRRFLLPILLVVLAAPAEAQQQTPGAVFTRYCVTCHNATTKVAGLVIDPAELSNVAANPELWEKVVRKLRSSAMPPADAPRPDQATYAPVATFLETELDRAAAARPNPGRMPLLHRLSRTEYQNAVRDLLALDALPQEMDFSTLLPQDNIRAASTTSRTCSSSRRQRWSATWTPRGKSAASRSAIPECRRWSTFTGCLRSTGRTRGLTSCRLERAAASRPQHFPVDGDYDVQARSGGRGPRGRTSSRSASTASART